MFFQQVCQKDFFTLLFMLKNSNIGSRLHVFYLRYVKIELSFVSLLSCRHTHIVDVPSKKTYTFDAYVMI